MSVPPSDSDPADQALLACQHALLAYGSSDGTVVTPLGDGLINETYLVEKLPASPLPFFGERAVLQRVSPIFGRAVHDDIEAITAHLQESGMVTPRLYRT